MDELVDDAAWLAATLAAALTRRASRR